MSYMCYKKEVDNGMEMNFCTGFNQMQKEVASLKPGVSQRGFKQCIERLLLKLNSIFPIQSQLNLGWPRKNKNRNRLRQDWGVPDSDKVVKSKNPSKNRFQLITEPGDEGMQMFEYEYKAEDVKEGKRGVLGMGDPQGGATIYAQMSIMS